MFDDRKASRSKSVLAASLLIACALGCAESHRRSSDHSDGATRSDDRRSGSLEPGREGESMRDEDAARPEAGDSARGSDAGDGKANRRPIFIEVSDRIDAVYDSKRNRVYVSTRHGEVLQYDLAEGTLTSLIDIHGEAWGLDFSPNEDLLLVADMKANLAQRLSAIHVVDLVTGEEDRIVIHTEDGEAGTITGIFLDDATALITSTYAGSGFAPMRLIHLADGSMQKLRTTTDETTLTMSADRSTVAYAQGDADSGPFGRYDVATGEFHDANSQGFVYEIGVSRDGSQFALLSQGQAILYDQALNQIGIIGEPGSLGAKLFAGVVYSPDSDRIYLASTTTDGLSSTIGAVDSRTFMPIATIDTAHKFNWVGNHAFESGRLRISRDGGLLLATVNGGVTVYRVDELGHS